MAATSPVIRAVLAFLALPGVIGFAVPLLLAGAVPLPFVRSAGPEVDHPFNQFALLPLIAGTVLLLWCVRDFLVSGKGTLAPWDPPRHLVVRGPYRFSRNPMYIAVTLILIGWAIGFRSGALWLYGLLVMIAFYLRVRLNEEPYLARTHRGAWDRYRMQVPRWIFPSRKALLLTVATLIVAVPLAGLVFEAYEDGRTRQEFTAPGMLVDIGGRRLHLLCIGEGSPIVMFEASGFGVSSLSSASVRERVASRTRVCSYDRIGMGWSDPPPSVVTVGELSRELAVLQDRAGLPAPFVVVASSIGGLNAEMFARRYPERAAGLIFLDAATSDLLEQQSSIVPGAGAGAVILAAAAQLGVVRLLDPFNLTGDSDEVRRSRGFTYGGRAMGAIAAIVRGAPESVREFKAAPPLRSDIPLVVLSASDPRALNIRGLRELSARRSDLRLASHQRLAKASTRGTWRTVPKSEHLIAVSNPDVVIDAIYAMLDDIR